MSLEGLLYTTGLILKPTKVILIIGGSNNQSFLKSAEKGKISSEKDRKQES